MLEQGAVIQSSLVQHTLTAASPSAPEESPAGGDELQSPALTSLHTLTPQPLLLDYRMPQMQSVDTHTPWFLYPTSLELAPTSEAGVPAGWQGRGIKDHL